MEEYMTKLKDAVLKYSVNVFHAGKPKKDMHARKRTNQQLTDQQVNIHNKQKNNPSKNNNNNNNNNQRKKLPTSSEAKTETNQLISLQPNNFS